MARKTLSSAFVLLFALSLTLMATACDDGESTDPADTAPDTASDGMTGDTPAVPDMVVAGPDRALYGFIDVAFVYRDDLSNDEAPLYRASNDVTGTPLRQSDLTPVTSGIDCGDSGTCMVTADFGFLLYQQGTELQVAEIGADGTVDAADLQLMASDLSQIVIAGTRVAYVAAGQIYYIDLAGGLSVPENMGSVIIDDGSGLTYSGGGIALADAGDFMFVYRYDLSSLGVFRLNLATKAETLSYRFGIPRGSGSFFADDNPMVVTRDGETAVVLVEGLAMYDTCTSDQACGDIAEGSCNYFVNQSGVQSSTGLCGANQRVLYSFALDGGDLGSVCSTDADCDPRHTCQVDPTTLTAALESICAPTRYVLGPKSSQSCALAAAEEGQFADVKRKLRMTDDDRVVFLGINDCQEFNVANNAIVTIDATLDPTSLTFLEGPYTQDHGASLCFSESEMVWDYPSCTLALQDFDLAPTGGLVVRASGQDHEIGREVWIWNEDGEKYPLTNDVFYDADEIYATTP